MTTPHHEPSAPQPPAAESRDRIYRSPAGIAGGVLLLAIVAWLGLDAIFAGHGRTPWLALATLIMVVPPVVAFTLRPAVYANGDRVRIRNPLRVIVLPWGQVASLRSSFSNEVVTESGTKYQLWAVPVSLRARKKASRRETRAAADKAAGRTGRGGGGLGGAFGGGALGGGLSRGAAVPDGPVRAETDKVMDELKEFMEARGQAETAQGEVAVRWAYEVVGPTLAGAILLAILLLVG